MIRRMAAPLTKLAIFTAVTVVSVLLLLAGIQSSYFADTTSYKARFVDASGLIKGSDVRIAGVRIGQVTDVEVADRNQAEVTFDADEGRALPSGVVASIKYQNLIGQRFLDLSRGNGPVNSRLPEGGTIPLSQTRPPLDLTVVFNGFKPLFAALAPQQINQLASEVIQVLQGESGNVGTLLAQTADLTNSIADKDAVIGSVIDNLNSVLDTVNARDDRLSGLIVSLQQLVSGLAQDRQAIGNSLGPIADLTTTTAGFLRDVRPPLRDDIGKLGQEAAVLNANRGLIDNFLRLTPEKARNFGRLGSYGSWFNFYLCSAGVRFGGLPINLPTLNIPLPADGGSRCR